MRISDWSSDLCSSDLMRDHFPQWQADSGPQAPQRDQYADQEEFARDDQRDTEQHQHAGDEGRRGIDEEPAFFARRRLERLRSEEHTSELQSLMRISYAVFCLKKKNTEKRKTTYVDLEN